jgi:hypothetical protein
MSPEAIQAISSPGRISYRSAMGFGNVTSYLELTFAISLP